MKRLLVFPVQGLVLLLALATTTSAQTAGSTEEVRTAARGHIGPFYFTPTFLVEEFGIDTNVFNNAEQKTDFTFTLVPGATVWVPFGSRGLVTTAVNSDFIYYHAFANQRSINPSVVVRGDLFFNRVSLFASPSYIKTRRRANNEIDTRARRTQAGLAVGGDLRLSPKQTLDLEVSQSTTAYSKEERFEGVRLAETLNQEARMASLGVRHALTPLTTLRLGVDVLAQRFPLSPERDSDSVVIRSTVTFQPTTLISGRATLGHRRFSPLRASLADYSGVIADARLYYTLLGSTRVRFTAERDLHYSYSRPQPYFLNDTYGLTARHQFSRRLDVTGGYQWSRYTYFNRRPDPQFPGDVAFEDPAASQDVQPPRIRKTTTWSFSSGIRVGQSARVGLGASYTSRRSPASLSGGYQGLRFTSMLDYGL